MTCAASEDSDQPGHLPSLISRCCLHEEGLGPKLPKKCTGMTDQTGQMPRLILVFAGCIGLVGFTVLWLNNNPYFQVIVTFYVGASINRDITNDYTYIGAPFLMGTVALGRLL